jgi:tetrahydromethanopterin S-methyltransferase subunit G
MTEENRPREGTTPQSEDKAKIPRTLFSYEEVETIVKDFVVAWVEKRVEIDFVSFKEVQTINKAIGKELSVKEALDESEGGKAKFEKAIAICAGETSATPAEYTAAVYSLFHGILQYRMGRRISGEYSGASAQERLDELEKKLNATNHLVEQLVRWLRDALGV